MGMGSHIKKRKLYVWTQFRHKTSDSLYGRGSDVYFTVLYRVQFLAYEVCVATEPNLTLSISGYQK
ncbi:hypothetical protein CN577_30075 [Bacillus toyonensis]|nr:hypothetical protein CON93_30710 [Bacillus toyonensis]PEJ82715.1 hypothetical protein CN687_29220 [Bacillus toyonensis]PEL13200.1 hypothetical protein CN614_00565 [Bacillus toyonensis]PEM98352.1 hypothetical protein CN629_00575 [Bacillus toyonensis]PEO99398.1 hypothetical protein CN577_30075 [Bacillus toyonensis]